MIWVVVVYSGRGVFGRSTLKSADDKKFVIDFSWKHT